MAAFGRKPSSPVPQGHAIGQGLRTSTSIGPILCVMDWVTISGAIGVILLVTTPIVTALGLLDKALILIDRFRARFKKPEPGTGIPARTLAVIQEPRINSLWWSMGRWADRPMMQVIGDFYVTNKLDHPQQLAGALLKVRRWVFFTRIERGDTLVKDPSSHYSGDYAIPPLRKATVRVTFHALKPFKKPKKAFNSRVAIIDQYGQEHWIFARFKHIEDMFP